MLGVPLHAAWGVCASIQLVATFGCEKGKPPARNSQFEECVTVQTPQSFRKENVPESPTSSLPPLIEEKSHRF